MAKGTHLVMHLGLVLQFSLPELKCPQASGLGKQLEHFLNAFVLAAQTILSWTHATRTFQSILLLKMKNYHGER
jgi:hypothetical protein